MAEDEKNGNKKNKITRRDVIKGLSTAPILGVFAYDYWKKKTQEKIKNKVIQLDLGLNEDSSIVKPKKIKHQSKELVRVGIIGVGGRGTALLKAAGFVLQSEYENLSVKAKNNDKGAKRKLETYHNQEMLNVQVVGICDVYNRRA